jgi:hypothetical protein
VHKVGGAIQGVNLLGASCSVRSWVLNSVVCVECCRSRGCLANCRCGQQYRSAAVPILLHQWKHLIEEGSRCPCPKCQLTIQVGSSVRSGWPPFADACSSPMNWWVGKCCTSIW